VVRSNASLKMIATETQFHRFLWAASRDTRRRASVRSLYYSNSLSVASAALAKQTYSQQLCPQSLPPDMEGKRLDR